MNGLLHDLRLAVRGALSTRGFSVVAIVTLAVGIGANAAIFGVLDRVLLRPLPFEEPDRLAMVWGTVQSENRDRLPASLPDYFDWREMNGVFSDMALFRDWDFNVAGGPERPERLQGALVAAELFEVLGVEPQIGRGFRREEDRPGGEAVTILSHGLWKRWFGGDPGVLGEKLLLDGVPRRVVGVMPPGFSFPEESAIWAPLGFDRTSFPRRLHFVHVVARLKPGIGLDRAQAEMETVAANLAAEYPTTNLGRGVHLVPLARELVGDVRPALLLLQGAALLVFLIACFNVANLFTVRATSRSTEVAVRLALGGGRGHLARRFAAEGLVFALAGGVLGVALARLATGILSRVGPPEVLPPEGIQVDARVLGVALAASMTAAVVFSLIPLFQLSRGRLAGSLASGGRGGGVDRRSRGLQKALVVAEVALALALVVGAGLLLRSFTRLLTIDPGFETAGVQTLEIALPWPVYPRPEQTAQFYGTLLREVAELPWVDSVGASWTMPLAGLRLSERFDIVGRPPPLPGEHESASIQPITPGYFRTLGIPLLRGRGFSEHDDLAGEPVAMVNQALAERYWPGGDPLGEKLVFATDVGPVGSIPSAERRIVGVVASTKRMSLQEGDPPEIYIPHRQATWRAMTLAVRGRLAPGAMEEALRETVWALDSNLPVAPLRSLEDVVAATIAGPRFSTALLGTFAGIALLLAAVGIYGVMSYSAGRRVREIGLRMALGAAPRDVVGLVLREGLVLVVAGLALGTAGTLALSRFLQGMLVGVSSTDPVTYAAVACALAGVAILACYLPAFRASRVDPVGALRQE